MLDKNGFNEKITEIGSLEDIVGVRTMLAELSESVSDIFDLNSELSEKTKKFEEENEKLRSANMQLFLKVGEPKKPEDVIETPKPERIEKSFEELYNEK